MNTTQYIIEWKTINQNQFTKATFEAEDIAKVIQLLVEMLKSGNISPANIEILVVKKDNVDLGLDGVLAAETELQNYY